MAEVAILVPVLRRPHRVKPLLDSIESATPEPHRVLFIPDENDSQEIEALEQAGAEYFTVPPRTNWAAKLNEGYGRTTEPWLFCGADDLNFHPDWFSRALRWATPDTGVIGTNDLCNPRVMTGIHSTHMLVRRSYIDANGTVDEEGKLLHEGYAHEYADDELVQTVMARGVYVHAFDAIVEHLHPMVGKAEDDATYRQGRSATARSRRLFAQRRKLWKQLSTPQSSAATTPPARR